MVQLGELIDGVLGISPEADALEFQGAWVRWGDLARAKGAVDRILRPLGAEVRVGVLIRNRPTSVAALLACIASDACVVTLNPIYPDDRLAADILESGPGVLICEDNDGPRVLAAAALLGALVVTIPAELAGAQVAREADRPVDDFPKGRAAGVAVEMLTSGTTGAPKRVPLMRDGFTTSVLSALRFEKGRSADDAPQLRSGVQILTAPMAHIGGLMAMLNAVIAGRKAVLLERYEVGAFHDAIVRHRPRVVSTPPAALKMLLDAGFPREDFSSLRAYRTGTAPLDPDLADAFYQAYGVPVLQNYGATEFGGVAGWAVGDFEKYWPSKRGAVGRLNPGIEARVVDPETKVPLADGETGLLELKGKQIGGGSWLTTTDLAALDADGFLFILGRADNAIIRGGFKVHPDDVARVIQAHPAVLEAAVAGLPDARLGQVPAAAYTLAAGAADPGAEDLGRFVRERLAPYQVPQRFLCVDKLPRTLSMKVSQPELRALFAEGAGRG